MKIASIKHVRRFALCVGLLWAAGAHAATEPDQRPLMNTINGAKPNLVIMLDNSGSMGFPFLDSYSVGNQCKPDASSTTNCPTTNYELCPAGYYTGNTVSTAGAYYGKQIATPYGAGYICKRNGTNNWYYVTPDHVSIVDGSNPGWYAMRSSEVNPMYYNPRTTYTARVTAAGAPMTNPVVFVGNQSSSTFSYGQSSIGYNYSDTSKFVPSYKTYTSAPSGSDTDAIFSYAVCSDAACTTRTVVNVSQGSPASITLPANNTRTDCGAGHVTTCTNAQEIANIANWYTWYRNRYLGIETAIGQAMFNANIDNKIRLGYGQMNQFANGTPASTALTRGVRYFTDESSSNNWKTQFYSWLYGVVGAGGTPSHNAVRLVGDYYINNASPWKNDPTSSSALVTADLSCRRSYHIFLSDGAWNANTASFPVTYQKFASIDGPTFTGNPSGNAASLAYSPNGGSSRDLYIPYGDSQQSTNGLADLTAYYYWRTDMSSAANNVPQLESTHNPTFWQNMTSYTIGWGLTPSGEISGATSGLTFAQINKYQGDWLSGVASGSLQKPTWATGDLNTATSDQKRIDDFIRAGYTGGGRAYSVWSANDVSSAFTQILGDIAGNGNDAGVAVSAGSGTVTTLAGQVKYTTQYDAANNTGDIKAYQLDADGGFAKRDSKNVPIPDWVTSSQLPQPSDRKFYALSGYVPASSNTSASLRKSIDYSTTLSSLPSDFQSLLNSDGLQKTDATFIDWILGTDGLADVNGTVYRTRKSNGTARQLIGASVNSPPLYVGSRLDMVYTGSSVGGNSSYADYLTNKKAAPANIYSANNEGMVHVFNAAKPLSASSPAGATAVQIGGKAVNAGQEVAAYMPKGAMGEQISLASTSFKFHYLLDGPLAEHDIYDDEANTPAEKKGWRDVIYGTGGRAGKFAYALESPLNITRDGSNAITYADRVPGKNHFLWEINSGMSGFGDMGFISNTATAGQLDNGDWVTLMNSGHYADSGSSIGLYVLDALTGRKKYFIPIPTAYAASNRGLGGVVAVRDASRRIVAAYAGDAKGNLWRFDLRTASGHTPSLSYGKPLFSTPSGEPIYAAPTWQTHPGDGVNCTYSASTQCGAIVVVGTGMLLENNDISSTTTNSLYGVWDPTPIGSNDASGFNTITASQLQTQSLVSSSALTGTNQSTGFTFYQVTTNTVDWKTQKGWKLALGVLSAPGVTTGGERVIGDPVNLGSSVVFTSVFIQAQSGSNTESCETTNNLPNAIYIVDALTGGNKISFAPDGTKFLHYSVAYTVGGGYTRGDILTQSGSDSGGMPNESVPDLKPQTKCTGKSGWETGTSGSVKVADDCDPPVTSGDGKHWNRSWRQILKPPA